MCKQDIVKAKKLMAFEVTKLVHGESEAIKAQETAINLFEKGQINTENMPTEKFQTEGNINVIDFLSSLTIIKSKSEARRLIEQGAVEIDGNKIQDINQILKLENDQEVIVKKGKKTFVKVIVG